MGWKPCCCAGHAPPGQGNILIWTENSALGQDPTLFYQYAIRNWEMVGGRIDFPNDWRRFHRLSDPVSTLLTGYRLVVWPSPISDPPWSALVNFPRAPGYDKGASISYLGPPGEPFFRGRLLRTCNSVHDPTTPLVWAYTQKLNRANMWTGGLPFGPNTIGFDGNPENFSGGSHNLVWPYNALRLSAMFGARVLNFWIKDSSNISGLYVEYVAVSSGEPTRVINIVEASRSFLVYKPFLGVTDGIQFVNLSDNNALNPQWLSTHDVEPDNRWFIQNVFTAPLPGEGGFDPIDGFLDLYPQVPPG